MTITLRKKKLANNKISLYLDVYHNGKRNYEFLNLYLEKASDKNKENLELAKQIKNKRETEFKENNFEYVPPTKLNISILAYYKQYIEHYTKQDKRTIVSSYNKFETFLKERKILDISIAAFDKNLVQEFKEYLEKNLNGETPFNYFAKFKRIFPKALDEKLISVVPTKGISIIRTDGIKKAILDVKEIQALASAYCGNEQVKRAFLFACNTGLRLCDVRKLTWSNVDNNKLTFIQSKIVHSSSKALLVVDLNNSAMKLIGERKNNNDLIFKLPTPQAIKKLFKNWSINAKITKNFTFHSARHSFGVNLLRSDVGGADVKTVSSLLGHSSLKMTEKYTRIIDELRTKAVNNLPEIQF
jgi:integrase